MTVAATRTVAQKMVVRPGARAYLHGAPAAVVAAMDLPDLDLVTAADARALDGELDYAHLFVVRGEDMRREFPVLRDHVRRGGMLWVSWPKGRRLGTDLTLPAVVAIGYDLGMVESTCLRVDETWAGLKFTHPRPGKRYANSHGTLRTPPG